MNAVRPARATRALLAAALASWLAGALPAGGDLPRTPAKGVVRVRIEGELDVGTRSALQRAVRRAESDRAGLLVELDTPGGEIERMWQLAAQIDEASQSGVHTVAWVHDRALSAGALLALACDDLYVRTQSTIGAAAPVTMQPGGTIGAIPDELMREKVTAALRSSFRGWAEAHHRPRAVGRGDGRSGAGRARGGRRRRARAW